MKQSLRSIALASIFALTLAPAIVAQTSPAMGGSAPRPKAMGGSAPRPEATSASSSATGAMGGSAPRPTVVGAAVSTVLSYLGF